MNNSTQELDGNTWEANVKSWLRLRYPNDFQEIPATDRGDGGIEGFCFSDQIVYQCYAPLSNFDTKTLYEHQRNKLTTDVRKFIKNNDRLLRLLPSNFKVRRYWYVIPEHRSGELNEHANVKTKEVIEAKLPYVGDDFLIMVKSKADFEIEQRQEQNRLLRKLNLDIEEVELKAITAWSVDNNEGVQNLDRKIRASMGLTDEADIQDQREYWIERKICTDNALEKLRSRSPEAWENLWSVKISRERLLRREFRKVGLNHIRVNQISDELAEDMISRVPNLEKLGAATLAEGLVGEWLQNCKLNFPLQ